MEVLCDTDKEARKAATLAVPAAEQECLDHQQQLSLKATDTEAVGMQTADEQQDQWLQLRTSRQEPCMLEPEQLTLWEAVGSRASYALTSVRPKLRSARPESAPWLLQPGFRV